MPASQKIWDPLRRKSVALTPEERVRQWMVGVLEETSRVPRHQMMSEVELHFGASDKVWRADILVYGPGGTPLAVVECKRPEVDLTPAVLEQALRYNLVLGVKCLVITNGTETRVFVRRTDDGETPDRVGGDASARADGGDASARADGGDVMAGSDRPSPWTGADHFLSYEEMLQL